MKTQTQFLMMYAGTPVDRLPDEIRSQVEGDPELCDQFNAQAEVAGLLKLKTYEQADPALEGRVRHRVGIRIQNGDHLRSSAKLDALPDWARMVAVVVVMFGLSLLTHREMLEDPPVETDLQTAAQAVAPDPIPASLNEPFLFDPAAFSLAFDPVPGDTDGDTDGDTGWVLTPERRLKIEESLLDLGLTETNRTQQVNTLPVTFQVP